MLDIHNTQMREDPYYWRNKVLFWRSLNEVDNSQATWVEEVSNWEILINNYCQLKKCKVFYWSFDEKLNKQHYIGGLHPNFRDYLISIGAEDITKETNGQLIDNNFGEKGHLIQSEYFHTFLI